MSREVRAAGEIGNTAVWPGELSGKRSQRSSAKETDDATLATKRGRLGKEASLRFWIHVLTTAEL